MATMIIISLVMLQITIILVSRITFKKMKNKLKERTGQLAKMESKCYVLQNQLEKKTERVDELEYIKETLNRDLITNQKLLQSLKEEYDYLSDKVDASLSGSVANA